MAQLYGYVRVSTREQNEERQLVAMRNFGVMEDGIFLDKQSGKDFQRKAYGQLLEKLKPGDILVIKSIDRLGRDYSETLEQWRIITKEIQAAIVVLDMPLLDTRQTERDLTGTFIADLVLQILSYVAQQEREFLRQRQAEGIELAKANGVKFGRRPMERPENFPEVHALWERREISAREAGRLLGVHYQTFQAWVNQQRNDE
ncbi:MAG: recombinase family protein [Defluviitaleaceae bacterium]|nr:recombinase family protein [Defluviitaleaceae bacterium]MCL2273648.1 recombinase family protein [Defluviitaleaceae bacterium]